MNTSSFDRILRQVVVVPLIVLLIGAGFFAWQIRNATSTVRTIQLDDAHMAETLSLEKLIIDQETGLRGFEITHDPRLLQTYTDAQQALPALFDKRRSIATPARAQAWDALRGTHDTWEQGFASPLIATIQAGGQTSDPTLNFRGKIMMDRIRAEIQNLNSFTQKDRDAATARWQNQVRTMIFGLLAASIIVGLILGFYIRRLMHRVSAAFRESHEVLRVRAEQTFRSEEKLRTTLQSIGDGVITCDAQGRVQSINDAAQQLTGWSEREAYNQPIELVFPILEESNHQPVENPVSRVNQSNKQARLENHTILRRRDGSEIFVLDSGSPVRDKHGNLTGVVLVFRDVTLARKSQAALLANEKLAVAGRLAASIAHEIHNPLDSVSNLLFLMDGVATDEERDHFLHLAKLEIARVTQISRAMLSLYRESKTPVELDLREMLESILLLLDTRFRMLDVRAERDLPPGLCVEGFPAELRQVFTNLLTNAAEASSRGGIIRIAAEVIPESRNDLEPRQSDGVLVTIADNGPGVPEPILPQLFQPFFTTKGERGTGLGLWISRGIITKHGGSIELESSTNPEDHGTTVSVFLATHPIMNAAA